MRGLRPYSLPLAVALAGAIGTALVAAIPALRFAYRAEELRLVLETVAGLVALVAAYLVLGRFRRTGRIDQLLLVCALGTLSLSTLTQVVQLATVGNRTVALATVGGNLTGAVLLAAAALAPPERRWPVRHVVLGVLGLLAVGVGGVLALTTLAPTDISRFASRDASRPQFTSSASVLTIQITSAVAYALAAVGFARRAAASRDPFLSFVAAAATLGSLSRVNYLLFPPLESGLVYTGDVLRVLVYVVLLVAAARELEEYWHGLAKGAVLEERRRIARELHDGVAQELAFIGRRARRIGEAGDDDLPRQIAASADRALADSRRAIAALTGPLDEPLDRTLAHAVQEVAARHGVDVDLHLASGIAITPEAREALVRITCEAVSNAARHAGASAIRVELTGGARTRVRVTDDGVGFDPEAPTPGRFGLQSMRERAHSGGGSFRLETSPGEGTEIEVELP